MARLNALIWEGEGEGEVCSKRNLSRVLFFATCLMATLKFNSRGLLENHKFLHSFFSPYLHSVPFLFIPPLPLFTCSRPDGENKNCPANLATQPKFFFSPCSSSKLRSKLVDSLSDEHQHRWKINFFVHLGPDFFPTWGVKSRSKLAENYSFSRWRDLNARLSMKRSN